MKTFLALIASAASIVLNLLRLRIRETETENALEDARDSAAASLRDALARGSVADAAAARADHAALGAQLRGEKPDNRKTKSPKK